MKRKAGGKQSEECFSFKWGDEKWCVFFSYVGLCRGLAVSLRLKLKGWLTSTHTHTHMHAL